MKEELPLAPDSESQQSQRCSFSLKNHHWIECTAATFGLLGPTPPLEPSAPSKTRREEKILHHSDVETLRKSVLKMDKTEIFKPEFWRPSSSPSFSAGCVLLSAVETLPHLQEIPFWTEAPGRHSKSPFREEHTSPSGRSASPSVGFRTCRSSSLDSRWTALDMNSSRETLRSIHSSWL